MHALLLLLITDKVESPACWQCAAESVLGEQFVCADGVDAFRCGKWLDLQTYCIMSSLHASDINTHIDITAGHTYF